MKITILFLLISLPLSLFSQNYEHVDSFVKSLEFERTESIEQVTLKITNPFKSDIEKVRAIYFWIASNIEYDYEGIDSYNWENYSTFEDILNATFLNRKGICSGYSYLFERMATLCDIDCEVISGFARADLETIFVKESNHAWNKVLIDEDWKLLDVTWARDTVRRVIDNFFFLTDPELFILNHFPEDYESALLEDTYSYDDFMNFPLYRPSFHRTGFSKHITKSGLLRATDDTVRINIQPNYECILLPMWYDLLEQEWVKVQAGEIEQKDGWLKLFVPRKSDFLLKVGALTQTDSTFSVTDELVYFKVENQ
ncbi:MAG: transglutaminase domain-containing protein [Cyclobacteriaceae bacterium]